MLLDGTTVFAAVYNPYSDEMFSAEKGKGAYLNGKPIKCGKHSYENSLVSIGMSPYYKDTLGEQTVNIVRECFLRCVDVRRSGSAALDFCNIASGRTDCFFECKLSPWDYSAGMLLVEEAGGIVTQFDGSPLAMNEPCSVIATNSVAYDEMKRVVNKHCSFVK